VEALVKFVKANLPPDGFSSLARADTWAEQALSPGDVRQLWVPPCAPLIRPADAAFGPASKPTPAAWVRTELASLLALP
jgi:hypothetical protein